MQIRAQLNPVPRARRLADGHGDGVGVGYAPGRANLIGEHLDYNGGHSLPIALPYWTYVVVTPDPSPGLRISSDGVGHYSDPFPIAARRAPRNEWTDYIVGVLEQVRTDLANLGPLPPGLSIEVTSSLPRGAGLASSASLTIATALALLRAAAPGAVPDIPTLRAVSQSAENDFVGTPTGGLDQASLLEAREGHALLVKFPEGDARPLTWCPSEVGLRLLVVDTGVRHAHSAGQYADRVSECRAAAALLGVRHLADADDPQRLNDPVLRRRARHVVSEERRVIDVVAALHDGDFEAVGAAMYRSHASLRDDYAVSCAELDHVVEIARSAGAIGARLTGGGFGGCALVLIADTLVDEFASTLTTTCAATGAPVPVLYDGTAAGCAGSVSGRGL